MLKRVISAISALLAVAMLIGTVSAARATELADEATATFANDGYTVDYTITADYGDTQEITVKLTNTGADIIEDWSLFYDDFGGVIADIKGAVLEKTQSGFKFDDLVMDYDAEFGIDSGMAEIFASFEEEYITDLECVKNDGLNADILPGKAVTFSYILNEVTGIPGWIGFEEDKPVEEVPDPADEVESAEEDLIDEPEPEEVLIEEEETVLLSRNSGLWSSGGVSTISNTRSEGSYADGLITFILEGSPLTATIIEAIAISTVLEIPETVSTVDGKVYNVTRIANNPRILLWPDTYKIRIPEGLLSIGENAFKDKTSVTTLEFKGQSKLKSIGNSAFSGTRITEITIPNTVTDIGSFAFSGTRISSITIPNTVTDIGSCAFNNCSKLKTVLFAANSILKNIGGSAFWGTEITTIAIPKSVTNIGSSAFAYCPNLKIVTFATDSQLKSIGDSAFSNTAINSIIIPRSVEGIPNDVFSSCANLAVVLFESPSKVLRIGITAFAGTGVQAITIPDSVTSINTSAFKNCAKLSSVTLKSSTKSVEIGGSAFEGTGITSIDFPSNYKNIYDKAFRNCTKLKTVIFRAQTPPYLGANVFQGTNNITTIKVPFGRIVDYSKATQLVPLKSKITGFCANTSHTPYTCSCKFRKGDINGDGRFTNNEDVFEILQYIIGTSNCLISKDADSRWASLITPASIARGWPDISDISQIYAFLAGQTSLILS